CLLQPAMATAKETWSPHAPNFEIVCYVVIRRPVGSVDIERIVVDVVILRSLIGVAAQSILSINSELLREAMRKLGKQRIVVRWGVVRKPEQPIHPRVQIRVVNQVQVSLATVIARLAALEPDGCHPVMAEIVLRVQGVSVSSGSILVRGVSVECYRGATDRQPGNGVERLNCGRI